jgi:hypothetical protein
LKRIITFTKGTRKRNSNQNNENQIEKYNTINSDWKMKLKINETFTKQQRKKIENQKNKNQIEKYNIW